MITAAVDIGTNSMRLLVVDGNGADIVRTQVVTGLGHGVDKTGRLDPDALGRTVEVLAGFGEVMRTHRVGAVRAVATSASRDAANREDFFDRAERALGVRPEVISGRDEASLAYAGATAGVAGSPVVIDIGGGSTEFVWMSGGVLNAVSFDIGSVRLTDRHLGKHPAAFDDVEAAGGACQALFARLDGCGADVALGVAGTWTSLAAISRADAGGVHGFHLARTEIDRMVLMLAGLTLAETEDLAGLDPARAPVILAGAVVAREAVRRLALDQVTVSERDLLDGVVAGLAA